MKHSEQRRTTILRIATIALLLVVVTSVAVAAPEDQAIAPITKDAMVVKLGNTTVPNTILQVGRDTSVPNIYTIITFDLSALPTAIEQARLNMGTIGSCQFGNSAAISVYGLNDSFDTWTTPTFVAVETAKAAGTLLASAPDEGIVNGAINDYFHWTGAAGSTFASWLNTQKSTGANVGTATLLLQMEGTIQGTIAFDDDTGTRCAAYSAPPILQLSGNSQPLTVTLSNFDSAEPAPTWPLYAGLGALALLAAAGVAWSRRRAALR